MIINSAGIIPYRFNPDTDEIEFFVGTSGDNSWSFLKGKQEPGENLWETAVREFREESGHDVSESESIFPINLGTYKQRRDKSITAFAIYWPDLNPDECHDKDNGREIKSYRWMNLEEILLVGYESHKLFFSKLANFKK